MPSLISFTESLFLICNAFLALVFFFVDEPLHMLRDLSQWERISHLIDAFLSTLSFFLGYLAISHSSGFLFWAYCLASVITILVSYKDEIIHKEECSVKENFVHAIMFSLSGIGFTVGAFLILLGGSAWIFLLAAFFGVFTMLWQIAFWFFFKNILNSRIKKYE